MKRGGYVYIITNKPKGTLYIGVTSDLMRRMDQHRRKEGSHVCDNLKEGHLAGF
jgi:putative endonuclease